MENTNSEVTNEGLARMIAERIEKLEEQIKEVREALAMK